MIKTPEMLLSLAAITVLAGFVSGHSIFQVRMMQCSDGSPLICEPRKYGSMVLIKVTKLAYEYRHMMV